MREVKEIEEQLKAINWAKKKAVEESKWETADLLRTVELDLFQKKSSYMNQTDDKKN